MTVFGAVNVAVEVLCIALTLYWVAIIIRILQSWFPVSATSPAAGFFSFVYGITEPVLGRVRRVLPNMGGLDLSPMLVALLIFFLRGVMGCGGGII